MQPQTRNNGAIAQLVEQRTENPCVPGSIPGGTTLKKSKISKRNREFLFSRKTRKSAEYNRFRCSKRWSGKGGAKISTEQDSFSLICNVLRIKKTRMVSYFCPTKKL